MKKVLIVLLILGLSAGGYYAFTRYQAQRRASTISNLQTVNVERGSLTATVGATGSVRASQTAILTWQTSGIVNQVMVAVGEQVAPDQVLANLKETSLPQSVILAAVDLVNAQNALDDILEPPAELALAQAEQAIVKAEDAVRDAQRYVDNLKSTASQTDIDQARATVILTRNVLDHAKENFAPYENKPEDNLTRAALQSALAQAQENYDSAVRRLNNLLGTVDTLDLSVGEANLELAKAQLQDLKDNYQELLDGASEDDIAAARARIAAAQATLNTKEITALFAGTITEVYPKPGDRVAPGTPAFRLDDLSRLLLDVQISEVDINRVAVGQTVNLTFDAILGKEYHGEVSEVGAVGNIVQGVVEFTVTIALNDADEAVKPGMTAAVNIVVNQLENVLLVPNRAVRVREGQRVVYVMDNGALQAVEITLGASSETVSEVIDGNLQVGDMVVLNPPTVFEQNGPPPFVRR